MACSAVRPQERPSPLLAPHGPSFSGSALLQMLHRRYRHLVTHHGGATSTSGSGVQATTGCGAKGAFGEMFVRSPQYRLPRTQDFSQQTRAAVVTP